jgi:hypothetical protein
MYIAHFSFTFVSHTQSKNKMLKPSLGSGSAPLCDAAIVLRPLLSSVRRLSRPVAALVAVRRRRLYYYYNYCYLLLCVTITIIIIIIASFYCYYFSIPSRPVAALESGQSPSMPPAPPPPSACHCRCHYGARPRSAPREAHPRGAPRSIVASVCLSSAHRAIARSSSSFSSIYGGGGARLQGGRGRGAMG